MPPIILKGKNQSWRKQEPLTQLGLWRTFHAASGQQFPEQMWGQKLRRLFSSTSLSTWTSLIPCRGVHPTATKVSSRRFHTRAGFSSQTLHIFNVRLRKVIPPLSFLNRPMGTRKKIKILTGNLVLSRGSLVFLVRVAVP